MSNIVRFGFEVLSNVFFIPALVPLAQQHRHFPLFVGVAQLLSAICFCMADFFGIPVFISPLNWHFISDVLSLTYACLLLIHICAFEDEERNMMLRYLAFFCSWIFKYRDAWDSIYWEALLVVSLCVLVIFSHVSKPERRRRFKKEHLERGIIFALISLIFFIGETQLFADTHRILMGCAHLGAGLACFEWWSVLPFKRERSPLGSMGGGASFV